MNSKRIAVAIVCTLSSQLFIGSVQVEARNKEAIKTSVQDRNFLQSCEEFFLHLRSGVIKIGMSIFADRRAGKTQSPKKDSKKSLNKQICAVAPAGPKVVRKNGDLHKGNKNGNAPLKGARSRSNKQSAEPGSKTASSSTPQAHVSKRIKSVEEAHYSSVEKQEVIGKYEDTEGKMIATAAVMPEISPAAAVAVPEGIPAGGLNDAGAAAANSPSDNRSDGKRRRSLISPLRILAGMFGGFSKNKSDAEKKISMNVESAQIRRTGRTSKRTSVQEKPVDDRLAVASEDAGGQKQINGYGNNANQSAKTAGSVDAGTRLLKGRAIKYRRVESQHKLVVPAGGKSAKRPGQVRSFGLNAKTYDVRPLAFSRGVHNVDPEIKILEYVNRAWRTLSCSNAVPWDGHSIAALVSPYQQHALINTSIGQVYCKKGTALLIVDRETDVVIYDLHDNLCHDVIIRVDGQDMELHFGQELTIARDGRTFYQINPGYQIVDERPRMCMLGSARVYLAKFSLASALFTLPPARSLIASKDRRERKLGYMIMKDSAIMTQMVTR